MKKLFLILTLAVCALSAHAQYIINSYRFTPAAPYSQNQIEFSGDYLSKGADFTGNADSKVGLVSIWFKRTLSGTTEYLMGSTRFEVKINASDIVQILAMNSSGGVILSMSSVATVTGTGWHHLVASWDLTDTAKRHLYIDDSSSLSVSTYSNGTIDWTVSSWAIGSDYSGTSQFTGCLGDCYLNTAEYLDVSVSGNRAKFNNAGSPVSLGANGSTPTGTQPIVFLSNPFATFQNNLGSGGNFTVNGSLGGCGEIPVPTDIVEWWDNRTADFGVTGALVDSWTGRKNGLVLTGASTTRPSLVTVNGKNYVYFNGKLLTIPAGFSWNQRGSTLFIVIKRGTGTSNTDAIWTMGTANGDSLFAAAQEFKIFNSSGATFTGLNHYHNIAILERLGNTVNNIVSVGKESFNGPANDAGTVSGGWLGAWSDGGSFPLEDADILGVVAYNRALTSAERADVKDFLSAHYGAQGRDDDKAVVMEGDSITFGTGSTNERYYSWPAQMADSLTRQVRYIKVATAGQTISSLAASRATGALAKCSAYGTRTVVLLIGTNDIGSNGRTDTQVETDIAAWITAVRSADASAKVVGITILPRTGMNPTQNGYIANVNTWIKTVADFNYTVDAAATLTDPTDATLFADGLHLTDAGYAVLSGLVKSVLLSHSLL